jgi:hypothetical protein
MAKNWQQWHREYDEPNSSLARRLTVVRAMVRRALREVGTGPHEQLRLISMCAGDGRDVLPVLAEPGRGRPVRALLVELDPVLAGRARTRAAELGLAGVEVRTGDAGVSDAYTTIARAHVVLACGIFGNVSAADAEQTVAALPGLLTTGGIVIWTRGRHDDGRDPSVALRDTFAAHGFTELSFTAPPDAHFRVGMHRLSAAPPDPALRPGRRMFTFG